MLIFADAAGQKLFRVTCDYDCHIKRGSVDPGEDWDPGDGTGLFSVRDGIINNWIGSNSIAITSITYNDLGLRFEFLHVNPKFVHPSGYHCKQGELMLLTGHSGIDPKTGKPYAAHVHINVYENAHCTDAGKIDKKGTRVNPNKYTQSVWVSATPVPIPVPDVIVYQILRNGVVIAEGAPMETIQNIFEQYKLSAEEGDELDLVKMNKTQSTTTYLANYIQPVIPHTVPEPSPKPQTRFNLVVAILNFIHNLWRR